MEGTTISDWEDEDTPTTNLEAVQVEDTGTTISDWEDEITPVTNAGTAISDWDDPAKIDKSQVIPTEEEESKAGFFAHLNKFDRRLEKKFRETPSDVGNLATYLESEYPIGGWTNKWSLEQPEGSSFWKSPDELYGVGFSDATPDERRGILKANQQARINRDFPELVNQSEDTPVTDIAGGLLGILASPTTATPIGATYKAATGIGAGLGFGYGVAESLADKGEVDFLRSGEYALYGAVLTPVFLGLGRGAKIAYTKYKEKGNVKKAAKEADDFVTNYEGIIYNYIAGGDSAAEATIKANKLFDISSEGMLDVVTTANRKVHYPTQKQARLYLEAEAAVNSGKVIKGGGIDDIFGVLSTRLQRISVPIWHRMRELEFNIHTRTHEDYTAVAPFLKQLSSLDKSERQAVTLGLFNQDFKLVETVFKKGGHTELLTNFKVVEDVLQKLHQSSKDAGIKVGYLANYFPRRIKDYSGFLKSIGSEEQSALNNVIRKAEVAKGGALTNAERIEMTDKYFRGRAHTTDSAAPFAKERVIEDVNIDMLQFYHTPEEALHTYISRVINETEKRTFFGRQTNTTEYGQINVSDSIGTLVQQEEKAGRLNSKNVEEIKKLLDARFIGGEQSPSSYIRTLKNTLYIGTLANPISTVTQAGDVFLGSFKTGIAPMIQALSKKITPGAPPIKLNDYGFIDIAAEFAEKDRTSKWLQNAFKLNLFSQTDQFGKEAVLNGALIKYTKEVKDPKKLQAFIKKWKPAFGDNLENLVDALRKGDSKSKDIRLLLWHDLSDMQPISLSELPVKYLNSPDARIFYMLKTFTLKSMDVMRREGVQLMMNKGTRIEGAKNFAKYAALFTAAGMSTDAVKSWMLGREYSMEDSAVESLFRLMGTSKYSADRIKDQPFAEIPKIILPPVGIVDGFINDALDYSDIAYKLGINDETAGDVKGKSMRNVPGIGKLWYEHLLGGKEDFQEKRDKERRGFRRGGLVTQARRLGFSKGGELSLGEQQRLVDYSNTEDSLLPVTEGTPEPTMSEGISADWNKRLESMDESRRDRESGEISLARSTVNTAGALAGGAFDTGGRLIKESVDTYLDNLKSFSPTGYNKVANKVTEAKEWALNTDAGKAAVEAAQAGYEEYSVWKEANPQDAKTFESVLNIGMFGWVAKGVSSQVNKLFDKPTVNTVDDIVPEKPILPPVATKKKAPIRDKGAEDTELTTLAEGLTESGGFKYKLPTMLLDLTVKDKVGDSKPSQWKYNINRWVKKGKIKKEELDDSRLMGWLDTQAANTKIATKDIFSFMKENSPILKTYTSKIGNRRDDEWYNSQPLIQERATVEGDYHNKLQEVGYLQDKDNIGDITANNKELVLKAAGWLHHTSVENIITGYQNTPIDADFKKFFATSSYADKAIEKETTAATVINDVDSVFHPDQPEFGSAQHRNEMINYILGSGSPERRNSHILGAIIEDVNQAFLKAEGTERELLNNYVDTFVAAGKAKAKHARFTYDNKTELSELSAEAMKRNAGDVSPNTWNNYALPNTRGKPVTILVQSKVGSEDRLKKLREFHKSIEDARTGAVLGQGIPSLEHRIKIMEKDIAKDRIDGRIFSTKRLITERRALKGALADFKKKTGVAWDDRDTYINKAETELYLEPHYTGIYGESPLKKDIPQENIILHIRGNVVEQSSFGEGKGLFINEQQSQAHQEAMGNARQFENLTEIAPGLRGISGYAKLDAGPKAAKLIEKKRNIQRAIDNLWGDIDVPANIALEHPDVKRISKIVTPMDEEIADIEMELRHLTGLPSNERMNLISDKSIPENLSHKKDWTPLAMKQSIKYAIDNNLNYIVLPIERRSISQIEQWGDNEPGVMQAIIDRNSIYSPRAYRSIVKKWDKDAKPFKDEYLDSDERGDWTEEDIHKVMVFPITKAIREGIKRDGLNAYRRGGLVTQMKAALQGD